MPWFERPSAIRARISRSRGVSSASGIDLAAVGEQLVDDRPVDHALAGRHALQRVDQLLDAADAFLQQVADRLGLSSMSRSA